MLTSLYLLNYKFNFISITDTCFNNSTEDLYTFAKYNPSHSLRTKNQQPSLSAIDVETKSPMSVSLPVTFKLSAKSRLWFNGTLFHNKK